MAPKSGSPEAGVAEATEGSDSIEAAELRLERVKRVSDVELQRDRFLPGSTFRVQGGEQRQWSG